MLLSAKHCFVLLLICSLTGCQGQFLSQKQVHPKIISLAPSITEILFALGLEKNIVGITTHCNYPSQTKTIEKVANFSGQANIERILILNPDIVFSTGLEQAPLVEKLDKLGLRVVLIYPRNLEEVFASILKIGELTEKETQAHALVNKMRKRLNRVKEKVKAIAEDQRPKVFVELCPDPLMTAGKDSFVGELIEIAGGRNIAKDTERAYSQFSPEIVVKRNPDCIILGYMQPEDSSPILKRMGWQDINAVKNKQIVTDINPDLFLRPGPRIIEGLEQIHLRISGVIR